MLSFFNSTVPCAVKKALVENGLSMTDIDLFVFHQASQLALDSLTNALQIPVEKMVVDLADTGNLVSASIPVALSRALESGRAKPGQLALLCGFGVGALLGYSAGGSLVSFFMSEIGFILERLDAQGDQPALYWRGEAYGAAGIARQVRENIDILAGQGVGQGGAVVLLKGDYSPRTVSLLLALIERQTISAPAAFDTREDACAFEFDQPGVRNKLWARWGNTVRAQRGARAACADSSASGSPAAQANPVHLRLYGTAERCGSQLRTPPAKIPQTPPCPANPQFLLFDHWGGLNTLLHCLANGSPVVLPENRSPDHICQLLEQHEVELLPRRPHF